MPDIQPVSPSEQPIHRGRQELRDNVDAIQDVNDLSTLVKSGDTAGGSLSGTYPSPALAANAVDAITEIAAALKSGADGTLATCTAGTSGNVAMWNADGDLVDGAGTPSTEATQANMEAEATGTLYVPPDLVKHSPGVAKVWANISADGTTVNGSYGLTSVTDTAVGVRTLNFSTNFSSAIFVPVGAAFQLTAVVSVSFDTPAAGSVRALVRDGSFHSSATDPSNVDRLTYVAIFGDQ